MPQKKAKNQGSMGSAMRYQERQKIGDGTLKGERKSDTGEREIRGKRAKEEAKPEEAQQGGEKPSGKIG